MNLNKRYGDHHSYSILSFMYDIVNDQYAFTQFLINEKYDFSTNKVNLIIRSFKSLNIDSINLIINNNYQILDLLGCPFEKLNCNYDSNCNSSEKINNNFNRNYHPYTSSINKLCRDENIELLKVFLKYDIEVNNHTSQLPNGNILENLICIEKKNILENANIKGNKEIINLLLENNYDQ